MKIHVMGKGEIPFKLHLFSGGEPHIALDPALITDERVWVESHVASMVDFGYLLCALSAIRRANPRALALYLPYFPGARQDHPEPGTPHTLEIYANALRPYNIKKIVTVDPHSSAVFGVAPNMYVIDPNEILNGRRYNAIIAPDGGAYGRANAVARTLNCPLVQATKKREQSTGRITKYELDQAAIGEIGVGRYLVVDDICDGGATFLLLAQAFRTPPTVSILDLYVSHGIFSRGLRDLSQVYEKIITTDAFPTLDLGSGFHNSSLEVVPLFGIVAPIMETILQ